MLQFTIILGVFFSSLMNYCWASSNPAALFPTTQNTLHPLPFWLTNKKPYATNAWFINFLLINEKEGVSEPVNIFPYLLRMSPQGISLGYSAADFYTEPVYPKVISALYYQFEEQLALGAKEKIRQYGVSSYHGLQVNLQWKNSQQQSMNAPILQGSPYLTLNYAQITPLLTSRFKWESINGQAQMLPLAKATRYVLKQSLNNKPWQTWILYSEYPIEFRWTTSKEGESLQATHPYTGWIRLVLQEDIAKKTHNDPGVLDNYSHTIPIDYQQNYFTSDRHLYYTLSWKTQNNQPPLMLALPHHQQNTYEDHAVNFFSIKGSMLGVTKKNWTIELPLVPISFLEKKTIPSEQKTLLQKALLQDGAQFIKQTFLDTGPYFTGKQFARAARLILLADYLGEKSVQEQMLRHLESLIIKKISTRSTWHFEYDTTWGGIIPSLDDYGARHYNDHHYHYGYWVYAFAVIGQFNPQWLKTKLPSKNYTPQDWIAHLINDYANPDPNNPYYPLQRYQDDYAGHSWASGLTAMRDGQNQQSSSEAVNAYYALALYAKAINDQKLFSWAQFLMTRELVAAQLYWQIPTNNRIYPSIFKKYNQVIGNLWASKVDINPFFIQCKTEYRCGLHYAFGIQMLPFTAISSALLEKNWLTDSFPNLKKLVTNHFGVITPAWKWLLIKGMVLVMNKEEKKLFFQQAIESDPQEYDNGDSKTNTLYFLADN